jgi:hypothetical protein
MRRYAFFVLIFPLVISIAMLAFHWPTGRLGYHFLAGYVTLFIPAVLVALTDEVAESKTLWARALRAAVTGLFVLPMAFLALESIKTGIRNTLYFWEDYLIAAPLGAAAAFFCSISFYPLRKRRARLSHSMANTRPLSK